MSDLGRGLGCLGLIADLAGVIGRSRDWAFRANEVDQLVERYKLGESVNVLARDLEVNCRTISAHLARRGVRTRYRILGEEEMANAVRLYERGLSLARVGEHFGVSAGTMLNAFKRTSVPTRPVGTNQWA